MAEETTTTAATRRNGGKFVVLADAVVVTVGKKGDNKPETMRVLRGQVLQGTSDSPTIRSLLETKAIRRVEDAEDLSNAQADLHDPLRSKERLTARKASQAASSPEDPAAPLVEGILPVNPSASELLSVQG